MSVEEKIYPNCSTIIRTVEIGGLTKSQLHQKLRQHSILMNKFGERLFNHHKFTVSDSVYSVRAVELKVRDLGFSKGTNLPQLFQKANQLGLKLCPLELGPRLRLEYLEQPEGYLGNPSWKNRAPYGSVTIASEILSEDVYFPKGFYLRRIKGELWLRGYIADNLHILKPDDHFVFCLNESLK